MMRQRGHSNPKKNFLRAYQPTRSTLNNNPEPGKKSMFERWGRRPMDAMSVDGHDGSHDGSGSDNESDETEKMGNAHGHWPEPGKSASKSPNNPTAKAPKKVGRISFSDSSSHSSQSESPTAVDQFPATGKQEEDGASTPKTGANRKSISAYFDPSTVVMPLPFGMDEKVPEVTRQISKQYTPQFSPDPVGGPSTTSTSAEHNKQVGVEPSEISDNRRRNSLEDVLRGEGQVSIFDRRPNVSGRDPTIVNSIHEEEEFYERGRSLLREPMIPREAYIDQMERSLSPPTIDTRLQSTVDSRCSVGSRMHFSVTSRMSSTPKRLPDDPNATIFIPIQPGIRVPLRRCPEVQAALDNEFYDTPCCPCCDRQLAVIADAAFLYCPLCHEISPLFGSISAVGNFPREPEYLRFGLGLGMTWETLKQVHAELYPYGKPLSQQQREDDDQQYIHSNMK